MFIRGSPWKKMFQYIGYKKLETNKYHIARLAHKNLKTSIFSECFADRLEVYREYVTVAINVKEPILKIFSDM